VPATDSGRNYEPSASYRIASGLPTYTRGPTVQGINGRVSQKDRAPCHLVRSSNDIEGQDSTLAPTLSSGVSSEAESLAPP
jgi:hypothetical protein